MGKRKGGRGERHGHHGHFVRAELVLPGVIGDRVSAVRRKSGSSLFTKRNSISTRHDSQRHRYRQREKPHRRCYISPDGAGHESQNQIKEGPNCAASSTRTGWSGCSGRGRRGLILHRRSAFALLPKRCMRAISHCSHAVHAWYHHRCISSTVRSIRISLLYSILQRNSHIHTVHTYSTYLHSS